MINFSDFKKLFCITCYFKAGDIVIEVHNFSELRNLAIMMPKSDPHQNFSLYGSHEQ